MFNHFRLFLVIAMTIALPLESEAVPPRVRIPSIHGYSHNHGGELPHSQSLQKTMVHGSQHTMPKTTHNELPVEAHQTLKDIDKGGPFRYTQDDTTFHNREGKLPAKEPDYYREYTVETPDANDRGAKRIIIGKDGEKYYTDDHYQTFKEITE